MLNVNNEKHMSILARYSAPFITRKTFIELTNYFPDDDLWFGEEDDESAVNTIKTILQTYELPEEEPVKEDWGLSDEEYYDALEDS
jgi:hypothetical protein